MNLLIENLLTERFHDVIQFVDINGSILVLIEHLESDFELCFLFIWKLNETSGIMTIS